MNVFSFLFSFKGSMTQIEYLVGVSAGIILYSVLVTLVSLGLHGSGDDISNSMKILKAFLYLSSIIMVIITHFALGAKRLRDLQWSQWLLILCAIPIVNFFMQLLFILIPGEAVEMNRNS